MFSRDIGHVGLRRCYIMNIIIVGVNTMHKLTVKVDKNRK